MNLDTLLRTCESKGIKFNLSGEKLSVKAPPGAIDKVLGNTLKQYKSELIDFLNANNTAAQAALKEIKAQDSSGALPLSFGQQRLWLLHQMDPASAQYHIPFIVSLEGQLNTQALELTFSDIVFRHKVLRSCYRENDGKPYQVVVNDYQFAVEYVTFPSQPSELKVQEEIAKQLSRPFDLTREILLRVVVIEVTKNQHILMAVMHHIASDAWSVNVLLEEFLDNYQRLCQGLDMNAATNYLQYSDFAQWQQDFVNSSELSKQLDYWHEHLSNGPALHSLPLDYKRPAKMSFKGAEHKTRINSELTGKIQKLCRKHDLTLFMLLDAAVKLVFSHYSGVTDIVVGTPVSGRHLPKTERLIGFFVNTLALRVDIGGCETLLDVTTQVKQTLLNGMANQDAPFDLVVERVSPPRSSGYNPIFQTMLVVQNKSASELSVGDLKVSDITFSTQVSKFDITITVTETENDLRVSWEYATDLFAQDTIAGMAESFEVVLTELVTNIQQPVAEVNLCPIAKHQQQLNTGKGTRIALDGRSVMDLFGEVSKSNADKTAVSDEEQHLSFEQLDSLSDKLAANLQKQGVKKGDRVGVCLTRDRFLPVALLAIFKSGAAYVPLDPNYPLERLHYMAQDARIELAVVDEQTHSHMQSTAVVTLNMSKVLSSPAIGPVTKQLLQHSDSAYLIYTSGSTGEPKGVEVTHGNLLNLLLWAEQQYTESERKVVLASTSLSFDLSVFEMFLPLAFGTEVRIVKNLLRLLESATAGHDVTLINTVPSAISTVAQAQAIPNSVRVVNVAGEVLTRANAETIYEHSSVEKVYNLYGPSEDTTYSTWELVKQGEAAEPTIGRPLPNTTAYVLDKQLRPVANNVLGELYLAGGGVTAGYFGRKEQTENCFIDNPFDEGVFYKTGDMVRWNNNAQLVFLGRRDHQVKIRGYRIELGEIESAILAVPGVDKVAVVVAGEDGDILIGCIVLNNRSLSGTIVETIQSQLKSDLPPQMQPSAIHIVDQLPHTPSGKINRKAIVLPDLEIADQNTALPETEHEVLLMDIWCEVLGAPVTSVTHDFFRIGGHSLHAARVLSRIREKTSVHLEIVDLFQHPTIRGLASLMNSSETKGALQTIPKKPEHVRSPLSYAQKRLWFIDGVLGEDSKSTYNLPLVLKLTGRLDIIAVRQALKSLVHRHEVLRTAISVAQGQSWPEQVVSESAVPVLEILSPEASVSEDELHAMVHQFVTRPFTLSEPLKLRAGLLQIADDENLLVMSMHHIASDGWSLKVLLEEFHSLYLGAREGRSECLPDLPIQYADYTYWQSQNDKYTTDSIDFWRENLRNIPMAHSLPLDFQRKQEVSFKGRTHRIVFDEKLSKTIQTFSREQGVTTFILLQSAFAILCSKWSRTYDVVMGTAYANRSSKELEPLIGFFVNTVVLRSKIDICQSFTALLRNTKQEIANAFNHGALPFDYLIDILKMPRSDAIHPIFQIMFNMQKADMPALVMDELQVSHWPVASTFSKFDLSLNIVESEGQFVCDWEYCSDLFKQQSIENLASSFSVLLENLLSHPTKPIDKVSMLGESQKRLLSSIQSLGSGYDRTPLPNSFDAIAQSKANQVALRCGDQSLTFEQLVMRSSYLASVLVRRGVRRGQFVGICLNRSIDMIVAIFAIHRIGAAYVPLDPSYPALRLQYMLEDANPVVLITATEQQEALSFNGEKVLIDRLGYQPVSISESVQVSPEEAAYVIYTSGSTGRPKGVVVSHGSLMNLAYNLETDIISPLAAPPRWALNASISFDASLQGIAMLYLGSELQVLTESQRQEPSELLSYFSQFGATLFDCTPSLLEVLLNAHEVSDLKLCLPSVIVGGEKLSDDLWQRMVQLNECEGVLCWNVYGPTESTVDATIVLVQPTEQGSTIGKPLQGVEVRIVDEQGIEVPTGVFGELLLAGQGLAQGYLRRPELTAERFINDVSSSGVKQRYYRTGDLVRWKNDAQLGWCLDYAARIDNQIKLRGYRIELSEIEAVLKQHCQIDDAVVLFNDEKQLIVAYVVDKNSLGSEVLKHALAAHLPAFMVPQIIVSVDAIPLSPSGKVDVKLLAAQALSTEGVAFTTPNTKTEATLAGIWCSLLKIDQVSTTQSFYEAGGYSLLLIELATQVKAKFSVQLPLAQLIRHATIEKMATLIDSVLVGDVQLESEHRGTCKRLRHSSSEQPPLFLLPALDGFSSSYLELAASLGGDFSIYALEFDQYQVSSVVELAQTYLAQIREVQQDGPYFLAGWSFGGTVAHEIAALLRATDEEVGCLIKIDSGLQGNDQFSVTPTQLIEKLVLEYGNFDMSAIEAADGLDAKLEELLRQGLQTGIFPASMDLKQLQTRFEVIRTHYALLSTYQPTKFDGTSIFIRGRESVVDSSQVAQWRNYSNEQVEYEVAGDHHTLMVAPTFQETISCLDALLKNKENN
ncbi:non-ribosomal peptide synthetase [Pseudoalteromonas piscicida]|uniref:Carrier domain-containing protein n=1 Tax=Pseudoalteromonas piscicida TaxID=43662 RepID=A0A2A5JN89_PSEO7|nr:non-ribosomal peptide synthetase [Pseudoalteromonas piscicida]PCK30721.1 hypothetical protein CEX98_16375 [Pseudoalteromonas piscicida]